jgi:hypothetical protein
VFILEAAPSLEELSITVWDHWCVSYPYEPYSEITDVQWKTCDSDFKHDNLVKLTIFGFQPDNNFMGYTRRVIETAVRIKEVKGASRLGQERLGPALATMAATDHAPAPLPP